MVPLLIPFILTVLLLQREAAGHFPSHPEEFSPIQTRLHFRCFISNEADLLVTLSPLEEWEGLSLRCASRRLLVTFLSLIGYIKHSTEFQRSSTENEATVSAARHVLYWCVTF